jgi:glycosyltransferase involved in cell wall biosynthesis
MRVLAFCDYYASSGGIGGAERVAREVYQRLVAQGVEVAVVGATGGRKPEGPERPADSEPTFLPERGWDLSRALGVQLMVSPSLRRRGHRETVAFKPDVIHVNGLHFHGSVVGSRLARQRGLPLVATAHLAEVSAMPGRLRPAAAAFDHLVGGRIVQRADCVVAVSSAVAEHVTSLGAAPTHIVVAHNGVDHTKFNPRRRRPREKWLQAIIIGRLISNKGTLHALDAVAKARATGRDVRLVVVGDGPLEGAVTRRAASSELAGAVQLVGRVDDVDRWLLGADVALRPSYTEGLSLAVLEALASGVPVICTNVSGNTEVVSDGVNGRVVAVGDADAMCDALVELHDDRAMLHRMSEAAVRTAAPYSWEASALAHLKAFSMASGATPSAGASS